MMKIRMVCKLEWLHSCRTANSYIPEPHSEKSTCSTSIPWSMSVLKEHNDFRRGVSNEEDAVREKRESPSQRPACGLRPRRGHHAF